MRYYIGVDIGTTATKAVAFSTSGENVAITSAYYAMQHPQPGWSEQDPQEILQAVITCINHILQALTPHPPVFLSFSAAMHSILAVDEKGQPLTSAIIWADNRSADIAEALRATKQGADFYRATGVPIHSMSPLCKLLWLKKQEPVVFARAARFIGLKEYVFFHCFGKYLVDTSIAAATGLLNGESLAWEESILTYIGIANDQLSPVVSTQHVLYYEGTHPQLTIPLHTPVVVGASDGALSNIGTVGKDSHALVVSIGTSGAVRRIVNQPQTDVDMRTFCYHVKDQQYLAGGATNNGAVVLQWLKDELLQTEESFEDLLALAQAISPGSNGLLFLPYLLGERAPIWNAQAKGLCFGLTVQHSKAHLVRAAMEGVSYCLYSIAKVLFEKDEAEEVFATGGFARSPLWLQILANVFNKKVSVSTTVESAALGAVILGAEALGIACQPERKVEAIYEPDPVYYQVYSQGFEQFQRLYTLLAGEMK